VTVGLAQRVSPGAVVGVDIEGRQFEVGRAQARELAVPNVCFAQATIYDLPFAAGSFDAVLAHAVLYHLSDPGRALMEVQRVLRPGGVVGIRDTDTGGDLWFPSTPTLDRAWALISRVLEHSGGNPRFGRAQRAALRAAGFVRVVASASYDVFGTPEAAGRAAEYFADFIGREHAELIVAQGWAARPELEHLATALTTWGASPDAFLARARCEAVGWKP
jgi:SAM-dependent methyltransferase